MNTSVTQAKDASKQLKDVLHRMADFIALYETAEEKISLREQAIEDYVYKNEKIINEQLSKIEKEMALLREIMTEPGAARWRLSAQSALAEAKKQFEFEQKLHNEIKCSLTETATQFQHTTAATVAKVETLSGSINLSNFKLLVKEGVEEIQATGLKVIARIQNSLLGLQLKNLLLAFSVTIVVSVLIGLYANGEWPWEKHSRAVQERQAGKTLLKAWPYLSKKAQEELLAAASK